MNAANFNQDINQPALAIWGDYGLLVDGLGSNAVSNAFFDVGIKQGRADETNRKIGAYYRGGGQHDGWCR